MHGKTENKRILNTNAAKPQQMLIAMSELS